MTIVAWDGKIVASDRLSVFGGTPVETTKIFKLGNGKIIGWAGQRDQGLALRRWYENGYSPETWPSFQTREHYTSFIVIDKNGAGIYQTTPEFVVLEGHNFFAIGSGADYALGAMAMGANAKHAVEIAMKYDIDCGLGIDVIEV